MRARRSALTRPTGPMRWLAAAGAPGLLACLPAGAGAQVPRTLADSLDAARKQRIALEAALERQLATGIAERAKNLAMSTEAGALQRLATLLPPAPARLPP